MSHYNHDLLDAFENRNMGKFTEALEVYQADPNYFRVEKNCTVFELILSTPNCGKFIRKCIEYGGELYMKNASKQYPLHCVMESLSVENLFEIESLLTYNENNRKKISPYVNVKDSNGQNCLHILADTLNADNCEIIFEMKKVLLTHGCNTNFPNREDKTPFLMVLEKVSRMECGEELLDYFLKHGDVDFYTHRSKEIIELMSKLKKNFEIPQDKDFDVSFENMMQLLIGNEINKFETKFPAFEKLYKNTELFHEYCASFLEVAVENSLINIVDLLLECNVDVNRVSKISLRKIPPPFLAYKKANVGIFQSFLLCSKIQLYYERDSVKFTMLHQFFEDFKTCANTTFNLSNISKDFTGAQKKCFNLLLHHEKCDRAIINALDKFGKPAIYYSVRYKIDYITMKLLNNGAYIESVADKIRKSLLEEFLNSCITTNDRFYDDEDFEIKIDYRFLIPSKVCKPVIETDTPKVLPNCKKPAKDFKVLVPNSECEEYAEEMRPLKKIAENHEIERFLMHPVLSSFILLKWNKINFLIYINLFIILLYMFSFIPYIVLCHNLPSNEREKNFTYKFFYISSFISLSFLILRESMQFFLSFKQYIRARSNWIDLSLIMFSLTILLFEVQIYSDMSRILKTVIILLSVAEYFNLLGLLPLLSVSIYTKMFKKVAITFMKSLAFYSVMILAFAFSFYTLQGDKFSTDLIEINEGNWNEKVKGMPVTNATRSERYNNFYTIGLSIIKSFVMLSGELEGSYVHLEEFAYAVLFLLFLFLVVIVLYNLLNALAVSDTQEIKSDAKLIDLHQRILTMQESEKSIFNRHCMISNFLKMVISLFPKTLHDGEVIIKPNRGTRIFVNQEPVVLNDWLPNQLKILKKHQKINPEIIQDMCELLKKKRDEHIIAAERKLKENRFEKLANDIIKINEMISDMQRKM